MSKRGEGEGQPRPRQCPEPPERWAVWVPILSPGPMESKILILLGSPVAGILTHFLPGGHGRGKGKTIPCLDGPFTCRGCLDNLSVTWKGYLPAYCPGIGRKAIAEITAEAYRNCPQLAEQTPNALRGCRLKLTRLGVSPNARVKAELLNPYKGPNLPESFEVLPILRHIWGLDTRNGKGVLE